MSRQFTDVHKANLSAAARRRYENPAERVKTGVAARRRFEDPAERAKIGAANKGRTPSAETRAKLSAANRRRYENPAAREKTAAARWQGDDIGYDAAHVRARKALAGQPCSHADHTCKSRLEVALRHDTPAKYVKVDAPTGRRYSPRPEDYMRLCQSHHARYDKETARRHERRLDRIFVELVSS